MTDPKKKILVRFRKIWRVYKPGEVAAFELAERDENGHFFKAEDKDGKKEGADITDLGDRLLVQMEDPKYRTAVRLTAFEALFHHLTPKQMTLHGYSDEEIDKAMEKLDDVQKVKLEKLIAGEVDVERRGLVERVQVELQPVRRAR